MLTDTKIQGQMRKSINEIEVLLVEDNSEDAELVSRALENYNLLWVKDGEEALNYLFAQNSYADRNIENKPKLILLDLNLPQINGLETLKVIRRDGRTKSVPIVVLTGSKEEQDIINSYDLGVNSYIVKPNEFDKYMQAVVEIGYYWLLKGHAKINK